MMIQYKQSEEFEVSIGQTQYQHVHDVWPTTTPTPGTHHQVFGILRLQPEGCHRTQPGMVAPRATLVACVVVCAFQFVVVVCARRMK